MVYESIFDYLNEDVRFKDVHETCIDMEIMALMDRPKISLFLARKASELLIKLIIDLYPKFKKELDNEAKKNQKKHPSLWDMISGCWASGRCTNARGRMSIILRNGMKRRNCFIT